MPLQAQQICSLARQDARCPGFTVQSGQLLNMILSDLCQTYDFDLAKKTYNFNFNPGQLNSLTQAYQDFPSDYLRGVRNECFYVIQGQPYPMIPCDLAEFDMFVQQAGMQNFPYYFTVDMSQTPPRALFYDIPSGAYPVTVRYFSQMPDITTPETSTVVPWFPNQTYLRRRLGGELMSLTDDERAPDFLSDMEEAHPNGAGVMLRKYLKMKDDNENRVQTVKLDRRRFGQNWTTLPNTKTIGW